MSEFSDSLSIHAVGDIMPGISSVKALATGKTIPSRIHSNSESVFENIQPSLADGDLLLGTLECPLTDSFPYQKPEQAPFLLGPEQSAEAIKSAGFDCVSLSTNHMDDHGGHAVETTLQILQKYGLDYVGDPFGKCLERRFQENGRTIALGGFNLCDQGKQTRNDELFEFLDGASEVDLTVLLLHWGWGYEHLEMPSHDQVELGHSLIDAGADIVLGSHSHVFQQVEKYKGGIIAYSLGNFLFDMWRQENRKTGILKVEHDKNGSFDISITPAEITDGAVSPSCHKMKDLIIESPPKIPRSIERTATTTNLKHTAEIIMHYLRYSMDLPKDYHVTNMKRWSRKLATPQEVFR